MDRALAPVHLRGLTRERAVSPRGALVDLLDRVLQRGLLLDADLVVCLAGVPLVGVVLRAAVGGVETLRRHGLLADWDEALRRRAGAGRDGAATVPAGEGG